MKRISIGTDHAGFEYKSRVKSFIEEAGCRVIDRGCHSSESVDYPDIAALVARDVGEGRADGGVLLCGTGLGMSISANKIRGVRAALVHDHFTARMAAWHNRANVLCAGARIYSVEYINSLIKIWMETSFEERHQRRLDKITSLESP